MGCAECDRNFAAIGVNMHKISKNTDFSFFLGLALIQVCIGENEFILNFHPEARILSSVPISVRKLNESIALIKSSSDDPRFLTDLLGKRIRDFVAVDEYTIEVKFDDGAQLSITGDNGGPTSCEITFGQQFYAV
jgi:hypothetical protein